MQKPGEQPIPEASKRKILWENGLRGFGFSLQRDRGSTRSNSPSTDVTRTAAPAGTGL